MDIVKEKQEHIITCTSYTHHNISNTRINTHVYVVQSTTSFQYASTSTRATSIIMIAVLCVNMCMSVSTTVTSAKKSITQVWKFNFPNQTLLSSYSMICSPLWQLLAVHSLVKEQTCPHWTGFRHLGSTIMFQLN